MGEGKGGAWRACVFYSSIWVGEMGASYVQCASSDALCSKPEPPRLATPVTVASAIEVDKPRMGFNNGSSAHYYFPQPARPWVLPI